MREAAATPSTLNTSKRGIMRLARAALLATAGVAAAAAPASALDNEAKLLADLRALDHGKQRRILFAMVMAWPVNPEIERLRERSRLLTV
jgi:hypothetical protein